MAKNRIEKAPITLESKVKQLEKRLTKLELLIEKRFARKKREYTDEERKAIRARLLALVRIHTLLLFVF
jgi:hypothetical protein